MTNRPTSEQLTESIEMLKQSATTKQYHHVWRLIYEIEALKKEVERLRNEINFIANVDMSRAYDAEHVAVSVKSWALNVLEGVDSE